MVEITCSHCKKKTTITPQDYENQKMWYKHKFLCDSCRYIEYNFKGTYYLKPAVKTQFQNILGE